MGAGLQNSLLLCFIPNLIAYLCPGNKRPAMNNEQRINRWINSGEYRTEIDAALTKILRKSELARSEAETSSVFESELYFLIRSKTGIELDIRKETPINGIVHTFGKERHRTGGHGRLDAVLNSLVIEYKHCSKLQTSRQVEEAKMQVEEYLKALYDISGIKYGAILTDGIKIAYFQYVSGGVKSTMLRPMTVNDIDVIIRGILNNDTKKFEPVNIIADFAISPTSGSTSKEVAKILFGELLSVPTGKTSMLYEEWKNLMHLSVDDNGKSSDIEKRRKDLSLIFSCQINNPDLEYKALYALQTTYAIIVKLIACKVLDNLQFNKETNEYHDLLNLTSSQIQEFFKKMEDGYSYNSMGIRNFLEGDFFSWYADASQWSGSFYEKIKELIVEVDEYSAFSLNVTYAPIDIFKDLYMAIIPQSIRHSMGEYFTPEWIADCVVSECISKIGTGTWKAIDPCCGSGIFLLNLIKKAVGEVAVNALTKEEKKVIRDRVISSVYGIDINPLSVLSARVSYYLALYAFGDMKDVEIPVYLGDSAIIPASVTYDGIACYAYSIDNLKWKSFDVVLPKRLVCLKDFGQIMSEMQAFVKAERPDILYKVIYGKLNDAERQCGDLLEKIKSLCDALVYLHKNHWDGIWIRIATNFMLIARLGDMDMIVGNPPWVKWEHLPAAYTQKIKAFCDIRHIFCNDGGMYGGAQLNICALISNVSAANWLKQHGVLAFLMPDSIMSQNSYEEFRNFYVDYNLGKRLYLQCIDRWMPPMRPFKCGKKSVAQDFNTYYFSSYPVDYANGIPVRMIRKRARANDNVINKTYSFEDALEYLDIAQGKARQLASNSTAFTYVSNDFDYAPIIGKTAYLYRTGVESTPFEVFKMTGAGKSASKGHYRFRNFTLRTAKYKVKDIPADGWDFPTKYIYPMVEGPDIKPFECGKTDNYHIVPYDEQNTSAPVPLERLLETDYGLALYFSEQKKILDMQSDKSKTMHQGDEFYALSKIGKYTFAPYIVAARDNTNFCASVITPVLTPWGELKKSVCVKHTIIISQDSDGHFISEDESHFINGILNSSIVHSYIHDTFKTNGFSLKKSNLFIPKYDAGNALHQEIAGLSRMASKDASTREKITKELTDVYLRICNAENPNAGKGAMTS